MANRDELNREAKKAGVPEPETLPNAEAVREATEVAEGDKRVFFYPSEEGNRSVVAEDRDEADNKLNELEKDNDNG